MVKLSPQLTSQPSTEEESNVDFNVFPSCAVTRAMARKAKEEGDHVLSNTVLHQDSDEAGCNVDPDSSESGCPEEVSDTFLGSLFEQDFGSSPVESSEVLSEDEIVKVPVGYYLKDRVLIRKWCPPDISATEDWAVVHQVVVPKAYSNDILTMAHCLPLGGHLCINKTVNKIMKQFFWLGLRVTVVKWLANTS